MSISREKRSKKGTTKATGRDYAKEYRDYHGTKKQKLRRAGRNAARSKLEKSGDVRKGDGKDVSHDDHNTQNNKRSNLTVLPKSKNRSMK